MAEFDFKEYARQLRENAVKESDGVIRCSPELWEKIASIVENIPAGDVAEVKHGKWMEVDSDVGWTLVRCSVCEREYSLCEGEETDELHFCPFCGAKMDE